MRQLLISADDFGLCRGVTDSILETFDNGALTSTSILANGEAVEYALGEYGKRKEKLRLAVHLNLTEGPPLSDPGGIPLLVDAGGRFRHSPASLMFSYLFAGSARKAQWRNQVRSELTAQWRYIQARASTASADGHQHVHMIPFVFDIVAALPGITYIRIPAEPLYFVRGYAGVYISIHALARILFLFLGRRNRAYAAARKVGTTDYVLGFLFAGRMSYENVAAGLFALRGKADTVELIFHPGSAGPGELRQWGSTRFDKAWHYALARVREKDLLMSGQFRQLLRTEHTAEH